MRNRQEILEEIDELLGAKNELNDGITAQSVLNEIESYCRLVFEYTKIVIDHGESE